MIQESNIVLKLHYCHKFRYIASLEITSKKSIDEAYKQGRAHRHLINTIQNWTEASDAALNQKYITCNGGNKTLSTQLYSARLTQQGNKLKDSKDM
jgi:hypothetical protein